MFFLISLLRSAEKGVFMGSSKKRCTWYLEGNDISAHHAIGIRLGGCSVNLSCSDGRVHELWECQFKHTKEIKELSKKQGFYFSVWRKIGDGRIEHVPFFEGLSGVKKIIDPPAPLFSQGDQETVVPWSEKIPIT